MQKVNNVFGIEWNEDDREFQSPENVVKIVFHGDKRNLAGQERESSCESRRIYTDSDDREFWRVAFRENGIRAIRLEARRECRPLLSSKFSRSALPRRK